ncbi:hypothetical protein [Pseudomonas syringae group genomosp. 7]|uniref:hypothetical protein n=1 Tax=Pseudomonas syringae group genomosp. 7 TaxID=251699 RepID=UPI00376FEC7A
MGFGGGGCGGVGGCGGFWWVVGGGCGWFGWCVGGVDVLCFVVVVFWGLFVVCLWGCGWVLCCWVWGLWFSIVAAY